MGRESEENRFDYDAGRCYYCGKLGAKPRRIWIVIPGRKYRERWLVSLVCDDCLDAQTYQSLGRRYDKRAADRHFDSTDGENFRYGLYQ